MANNRPPSGAGAGLNPAHLASRLSGRVLLWCTLAILLLIAASVILKEGSWKEADKTASASDSRARVGEGPASVSPADPIASFDARDVKPLSAPEAIAINAAIPIATGAGSKSRPFVINPADMALRSNALQCLTAALYYEAGSETDDGQRAVAQVILNRMRHPVYPASVCGVVYQGSTRATGCQFSFTCDGSLTRIPSARGWARSREIAEEALSGRVYAPVGYATHYHADYVVPYWAASLDKAATVGRHIFYRWPGRNGTAPAFRQRYAEAEQIPSAIASAALAQAASPADDAPTVEAGDLEEELPVVQGPPSSTTADDLSKSRVAVVEDERVPPSLLADRAAGTLKLPPGRAAPTVNTAPQDEDAACPVNKRVAPVEAVRDARVTGAIPGTTAACS